MLSKNANTTIKPPPVTGTPDTSEFIRYHPDVLMLFAWADVLPLYLNGMSKLSKLRVSNITDDYSYVIAHSRNLFVTNFRVSFKANSFKITENNRMQVQSGATTEYVQELIYNIVGYK